MGAVFSNQERKRIISDIAHWKLELERGRQFDADDLESYVNMLQASDDNELKHWWDTTVGEWVASRHDISLPSDTRFQTWLDEQFTQLINGNPTAYGFITSIDIKHVLNHCTDSPN